MAKKRKDTSPLGPEEVTVAFLWYRADQWQRLRERAADPEVLEPTFELWRQFAELKLVQLWRAGHRIVKVDADVDELLFWCNWHGRPLDAAARAAYAAEKARNYS